MALYFSLLAHTGAEASLCPGGVVCDITDACRPQRDVLNSNSEAQCCAVTRKAKSEKGVTLGGRGLAGLLFL